MSRVTDPAAGPERPPIVSALADAARLVRAGQADLAVRRLRRALLEETAGAAAERATAGRFLAELLDSLRRPAEAAEAWTEVAGIAPDDPVAPIRRCGALIEAGDLDGARLALAAVVRPAGKHQGVDEAAYRLYRQALTRRGVGDRAGADALHDLLAAFDRTTRTIAGLDGAAAGALDNPAAVLDRAARAWDSGETPRPPQADAAVADGAADLLARCRGRRVLLAVRRRYHPQPDSRPCEILEYLRDTGRSVGLDMRWVDADDLVFFFDAPPARQQAVLAAVAAACRDWRPDILIVDCFFQPPGHALPPDALVAFFRDLRAATGVRIVPFYSDAHEAPQQAAIAASPAFADLIWHFEPSIPQMAVPEVAARTLLRMQPLPDFGHAADRPRRTIPAAFVGSLIRHPVRAYWMSLVERRGVPLSPLVSTHRTGEASANAPTMMDYAELLGRIRINVNFTRLNIHSNPGNGRIFRSTLSGCLAFEEDNADTPHFFAPYVHYVPFQDIDGLDRWLRFFAADDDWRLRIATQGQDWCRRHYSKEAVWAAILGRLDAAKPFAGPGEPS